jgi:hypothetical protein
MLAAFQVVFKDGINGEGLRRLRCLSSEDRAFNNYNCSQEKRYSFESLALDWCIWRTSEIDPKPRIIKGRPFGVGFECLAHFLQKRNTLYD